MRKANAGNTPVDQSRGSSGASLTDTIPLKSGEPQAPHAVAVRRRRLVLAGRPTLAFKMTSRRGRSIANEQRDR